MKNAILFIILCLVAVSVQAQTWSDLTDEQKLMQLKEFRADNQQYLQNTLGMNEDQRNDIDNVNICYLATLDRIDRYAKVDSTKMKLAGAATAARSFQLDAIMGEDKHQQYANYVMDKIKKAKNKN